MSATGRGAVRNEADFYPTPAWCVRRLLDAVPLPGGLWLEPAIGGGAIVKAVERDDVKWSGVELHDHALDPDLSRRIAIERADFLTLPARDRRWSVCITNPPFLLAMEFIERALPLADWCAFLLRINFLGGDDRADWMIAHPPDVYVLPNRPSFAQSVSCSEKKVGCDYAELLPLDVETPRRCPKCGARTRVSKSDATEYAWFVWPPDRKRDAGRLQVLARTPRAERCR